MKLKNSIESFNNRLNQVEEKFSTLKNKLFEMIQLEKQKEKRNRIRVKKAYGPYRTASKVLWKEKEREQKTFQVNNG